MAYITNKQTLVKYKALQQKKEAETQLNAEIKEAIIVFSAILGIGIVLLFLMMILIQIFI